MALAKTPDHPGMTVSRFETYCQVNFDGMVREILKYVAAQK